jgi:2-methylcitrate dehydratase PrpD
MAGQAIQSASTTAKLAEWITTFSIEVVPPEVLEATKMCIVDSVACAVGGAQLQSTKTLLEVTQESSGGSQVTVMGTPLKLGLLQALYVGGHAANALDFDDSFSGGSMAVHPGATVVPPAFALAEVRNLSGKDIIKAVLVGYEALLRIGRAINSSPARKAEVMGFGTCQTFGATIAAASLLKLSPVQLQHAFGIAGTHAPVPSVRKFVDGVRPYSWVKNCYGLSCQSGAFAALLAEKGFQGNIDIFDGPNGFWIMSGSDRYEPEKALDDLGSDWLIRGVEFKPYSCCRWAHTAIEAISQIRNGLSPDDIERVDIHGFRELTGPLSGDFPSTIIDAQFNMPYLAALELIGRSSSTGLHEADLTDPKTAEIAQRVFLHHEPVYDQAYNERGAKPVRVIITERSGRARETYLEDSFTSKRRNGFSKSQISEKFLSVAGSVLGAAKSKAALEALFNIEAFSAGELGKLLSVSRADPAGSPA